MKPLDLHRLIAKLATEAKVIAVQYVPDTVDDEDDTIVWARSWVTFRHPYETLTAGLVAWRIVEYADAFGPSPLPDVVVQALKMRFNDGHWPNATEIGAAGVELRHVTSLQNP